MNKDIHAPFIGVSIYISILSSCVLSLRRKAVRSQYLYIIYVKQALFRFAGKPESPAREIILRSREGQARTGRLYHIPGY